MNLAFNLENSPYFLGALLVLLLLILILRSPVKKLLKYLLKKIKAWNKKRKAKKAKKLKSEEKEKSEIKDVEHQIVKVVKIESGKKEVLGYWEKTLFLILGIGVIIAAHVKNWVFLTSKYEMFYSFVYAGTSHRNLTTIIVTHDMDDAESMANRIIK